MVSAGVDGSKLSASPETGSPADDRGGQRIDHYLRCRLGIHGGFPTFFSSSMVIFSLAGIGNGSTDEMIPSIFATLRPNRADAVGTFGAMLGTAFTAQVRATLGAPRPLAGSPNA